MLADTKALVRRLFEEVWNQGNLAAIDELFAPSYVRYDPAAPEAKGLAGFKQLVVRLRTAFPDLHFTLEEVIAEGDKVMSRALLRGTHRGDYLGIAPTGKPVAVMGMVVVRIAQGKFQEGWLMMDNLGLLQQLGVVPPVGQSTP
jgi:steroid delta-isomerase-like uncharacterized protein